MASLLFLKTVLLLTLLLSAGHSAKLTNKDCALLLQLKSSLDPRSTQLTNWNISNPNCCKKWTGVKCSSSSSSSRVIQLQLSNMELTGKLHPSIGSLSSLVKLDISNNKLVGSIPENITGLSKLQLLDLAYNHGIAGSIPASIGSLSSLVRLRLQSNKLTGSIPASFGLLSNLVYAELDDNSLTGPVPDGFTRNLSQLALLDLAQNRITGLPKDLSGLSRLGILYLGSNPLSFESISGIATLPFLGELHLDKAGLKGPLPGWLLTLNLRQSDDFLTSLLDLSSNSISGSIPSQIQRLSNVEVLQLNGNRLSGAIPPLLGNMTSLRRCSTWTA